MTKPQLRRDIDLIPMVANGRQVITVHDPLRLTQGQVALDAGLVSLLKMIDGTNDLRDIQVALMRSRGGQLVSFDEIQDIVEKLDRLYLLQSERFMVRLKELQDEFEKQPDRPLSHAGKSYDSDARNLTGFIEEVEGQLAPLLPLPSRSEIRGIIAPHIDIQVAKSTYVDLYRRLRGRQYDVVVILGINHRGGSGLYCVSEKNYMTPFGKLPADRDVIGIIRRRVSEGTLSDTDCDHRTEHSIEFQTLFLHYYLKQPFSIVPILCNSIHEFVAGGVNIFADARFGSMVEALREAGDRSGKEMLIVAGVDFAHVGRKFGHQAPADTMLDRTRENDRQIISCLEKGEPEKIYATAVETADRFNICGLPALLLFSRVFRGYTGELLSYATYDEQATRSAVTYASMIFSTMRSGAQETDRQRKKRKRENNYL